MLNYNPSALTDNKTLLEKLNEILLYLKENPCYKIYQTTDSYTVGGVFSVQNVIMKEGEKLENKDMILFSNGYTGVVTDLTETTYKIEQAVNLNGPQGKPGPQGPKGDAGEIPASLPATGAKIDGSLLVTGWQAEGIMFSGSFNGKQGYQQIKSGDFSSVKTAETTVRIKGQYWYGYASEEQDRPYFDITLTKSANTDYCGMFEARYLASNGLNVYNAWNLYADETELKLYQSNTTTNQSYTGIKIYEISSPAYASAPYIYPISDSAIKTNSFCQLFLSDSETNNLEIASKIDGAIMIRAKNTLPTVDIPYTLQVVETSAEGAFEIINSYVPSIPESPTSLPVSYKKASGELPTSGWTTIGQTLWTGKTVGFWSTSSTGATVSVNINDFTQPVTFGIEFNTSGTETATVESVTSDHSVQTFIHDGYTFRTLVYADKVVGNGVESASTAAGSLTSISIGRQVYTISDTAITANTAVKMYLTDAGGVKAYSKAVGSIQVTRDSVPTTAIPYEYEVEETSAEGLFEVINAYVPAVPTKTSQLTNDSGFITAADIPSATTLYEDSTGAATVTLSETINNGDIVRIKTNNGNVDHYYIGVAWNRAITVTESLMVTDESDVTVGTAINIDSLRFNIQDTSLILFHYFNTNITTAGAVTITNEKANVVIRKVERIHA